MKYHDWLTYYVTHTILAGAFDKLRLLDAATCLEDLKVPPGNRLEPMRGDRAGQWSISVNGQWRICFHWHARHAWDVEITDYH